MDDKEEEDSRSPPLLHEIFDRAARRHADRVAIDVAPGPARASRAVVTYGELLREADAMARRLAARADGGAPDPLVAIHLPRDTPSLYAAQLAVLKAGAAFTCIDPRFPDGHVQGVIAQAQPTAIVTNAAGVVRFRALGLDPALLMDVDERGAAKPDAGDPGDERPRVQRPTRDATRLAYVIYTSGTTGAPKGVMIEHRSIVNLVVSDMARFGLGPGDRVAQCSSPAYDSSIEETWLALAVGATLVPMDDETVRLGPDLVPWLRAERISVFCPPPTLLRTTGCADPHRALPGLRLLYVGGEALPQDLADLWAQGRRLENGYGPTECTVTVARSHVRAGHPVTIGTPVDGNRAWIVDDALDEVVDGTPGELLIGGAGLARGYRGLDQLTAERFPTHPRFGRVYRTGDLARRNGDGELEYLGRIDSQVKLRGYRVELGAVDAALARIAGVRAAACRVQSNGGRSANGHTADVLVAHIVPESRDAPPSVDALRRSLRETLPEYMVPSRFAFIDELPTSVGGKLDRRRLPEIAWHATGPAEAAATARDAPPCVAPPRDELERRIADAFASTLRPDGAIGVDDDFFLDLGGDSLGAVGVVCALRAAHDAAAHHVTVRDLYDARTVAALAVRLRERSPSHQPRALRPTIRPPRDAAPLRSTLVQSTWLAGTLVAASVASYAVAFHLAPWLLTELGAVVALALTPLLTIIGVGAYAATTISLLVILKRLLIGRAAPGRVAVWSAAWTRHWIVAHTARLVPWWLLEGTVFLHDVLRALGATIGSRVHIHRGVDLRRGGWDLLELGDDATLAQDAHIGLVELEDGHAVFGRVIVGARAIVDVRAGLSPGCTIECDAMLTALSWLAPGTTIPAGERWDGIPAAPAGRCAASTHHAVAARSRQRRWRSPLHPRLHGILMIAARLAGALLAAAPAFLAAMLVLLTTPTVAGPHGEALLAWLRDPGRSTATLLFAAAASVLLLPASLVLRALTLRVMGRVDPGVLSRWSVAYIGVWLRSGAVEGAGRWLSGTLFWPWWLRLAGMRIGRGCEISTIIDVLPGSVTVGDECFFADGIYFCSPRVERGWVTIEPTTLAAGTFLGNHAVVRAGTHWPAGLFVGVATIADEALARRVAPPDGASDGSDGNRARELNWFGHPPMALPHREVVHGDRRFTHEPGSIRRINRLLWEAARFALPVVPLLVALAWYRAIAAAEARPGAGPGVVGVAVAASLGAVAALCASVIALKWLLLGRVRAGQHPLWSCWCSRWDFLYVAWGFWSRGTLALLEGTLLLNMFLRLMGMRIGRRVVLGPGFAHVVDPDMLDFGDDATVACQFQSHSFEDRILKIDRLHIRAGASVGANTVVFYGVEIGAGARVEPHGVVMKRDVLEPGRAYVGCPTQEA